jgi:hypothetical protein
VICTPCHKPKTASDRRKGNKRNNAVTSTWKSKPRKGRKIGYRLFDGTPVDPNRLTARQQRTEER